MSIWYCQKCKALKGFSYGRCETCGDTTMFVRVAIDERMKRDAQLAKALFVKRPHECEDDPDPDYGL